jgi:hypothetical protein
VTTIDPQAKFELKIVGETPEDNFEIMLDNENTMHHEIGELYFEVSEGYGVLAAVWLDTGDAKALVDTLTFWLEQQKLLDNLP